MVRQKDELADMWSEGHPYQGGPVADEYPIRTPILQLICGLDKNWREKNYTHTYTVKRDDKPIAVQIFTGDKKPYTSYQIQKQM